MGGCNFLTQYRGYESFDVACFREFVGDAIASKNPVDVVAEFASATLDVKVQMVVIKKSAILILTVA